MGKKEEKAKVRTTQTERTFTLLEIILVITVFAFFIGIMIYLFASINVPGVGTLIDFIIACMGGLLVFVSLVIKHLFKREREKFVRSGILITLFYTVGFSAVLVIAIVVTYLVKDEYAAKVISLGAFIVSGTVEVIDYVKFQKNYLSQPDEETKGSDKQSDSKEPL